MVDILKKVSAIENHYPVLLRVTFEDKDKVKALGAKWDNINRLWFVDQDTFAAKWDDLKSWADSCSAGTLFAEHFYIAKLWRECWKCSGDTQVVAIILPKGSLTWDEDEVTQLRRPAYLLEINWIEREVAKLILQEECNFFNDYSKQMKMRYWMNHCDNCNMKQGNWTIHCNPSCFVGIDAHEFYLSGAAKKINKSIKVISNYSGNTKPHSGYYAEDILQNLEQRGFRVIINK